MRPTKTQVSLRIRAVRSDFVFRIRKLHPLLSNMCPVKILIRLRECSGWSESSVAGHTCQKVYVSDVGAHLILNVNQKQNTLKWEIRNFMKKKKKKKKKKKNRTQRYKGLARKNIIKLFAVFTLDITTAFCDVSSGSTLFAHYYLGYYGIS